MKKTVVIYYSNTGSNRFLANKIAEMLNCDIFEIKPKLNIQPLMVFGLSFGINNLQTNVAAYDRIILCGPVWMGKLIAPLKGFIRKYKKDIQKLIFITCCGSSYEVKDKKFGHNHVFRKIKELLGEKCVQCEAFPIPLLLPEDKKEDPDLVMNTRLTNENFKGEIAHVFTEFIEKIAV
jgi:flavodoxin